MQAEEGERLRKLWEKKGNVHCDHPQLDKEYYGGMEGDHICTTCGQCFTDGEVEQMRKERKLKSNPPLGKII